MTAQGQAPAFDSVPPTIRVCSKNPQGVFSGGGGTGDGVVVMATGEAVVGGFGVLKRIQMVHPKLHWHKIFVIFYASFSR